MMMKILITTFFLFTFCFIENVQISLCVALNNSSSEMAKAKDFPNRVSDSNTNS